MRSDRLRRISEASIWIYFILLAVAVVLQRYGVLDYALSTPVLLGCSCLIFFILIVGTPSGFYRLIFIVFVISRFLSLFTHGEAPVDFYTLDVLGYLFMAIALVRLVSKNSVVPPTAKSPLTILILFLALPPLFKFFDNPFIDRISIYAHFAILPLCFHIITIMGSRKDLVNGLNALILISGGMIIFHTLNNLL